MLYIYALSFDITPLFVAICEICLLKLTYGAYLVLSLKSGITNCTNYDMLDFIVKNNLGNILVVCPNSMLMTC